MSEKLTKTALKDELDRRIEWLEKSYKFDSHSGPGGPLLAVSYGRYCALKDMRYQIEHNLFIGGYVS